MKETQTTTQTKPPVDREAVRVLAIELGAREAARRLGLNEDTVCSWARRYNWQLPKRKTGRPCTDLASTLQAQPGDVLLAEHKSLETKTKTALMQTAAKAAADAAQKPPLEVSNTSQLRDLAGAAAKLFGWDADKKPGVQHNTLVITREQLQEIRALREQALREQTDVQGDE